MTVPDQTAVEKKAPTCYKHPDRETWVSCGRCGKPLCPDCMRHGPVGVRCADCLRPQRVDLGITEPTNVGAALGAGAGVAVVCTVLLVLSGWITATYAPNLLIAVLSGTLTAWTVWRISGRTYDRQTVRWSVLLGIAMPLLASLALLGIGLAKGISLPDVAAVLAVRDLLAIGLSGFFAWLLITRR